jgi:hypothetical protein
MTLGYTTIAFLITALNELEINSIDIGNASDLLQIVENI